MLLQATVLFLASLATARNVPSNVQQFYDDHINRGCSNPLSIKYGDGQGSDSNTVYCGDSNVVFLKGDKGYADMDIDCDGANNGEGRCSNDPSGQGQTAFKDTVKKYGISDLDSHIHTFVVLGNDNSREEGNGGQAYDPQDDNIKPLSVVAVVCDGKMFYGVWGDVNGGISTGEASLSMGELCFGKGSVSGDNGHGEKDVLYIAFPGDDAVAGSSVNWKAKSATEFENSLASIGDRLVKKIGDSNAVKTFTTKIKASATPAAGHKKGTKHQSWEDEE
ncbi:putative fungal chitosanase [Delitschia confertaspora ATCC 74209]|uniref:Endo-chitosanase n=1 Tax=Delitschia confertaspora ATCC 74209 TaxID=1513339 RepID=A0A9P4JJR3_9PLEO|nr:putative fungal chitosanase [Delitschia confertaspora ATCC 74209]